MRSNNIRVIDLNFLNTKNAIASYLIPWGEKAILIESGPTTTLPILEASLKGHGYSLESVSDLFVTHIHLDHAGAAGWLAKNGTRVHVHPKGGRHLINPEALLKSAKRIYQEAMDTLWGEVIAIPEQSVNLIEDGEAVRLGPHEIRAVSTPGHASHHHAYLFEGVCFSGDVGGVRIPGKPNLTLPMPPPEINFDGWRKSVMHLQSLNIDTLAPTHFGTYTDVGWHLDRIIQFLDEVELWLENEMEKQPDLMKLRDHYIDWFYQTFSGHGLDQSQYDLVEIINPSFMSADGLYRYWHKYREVD